VAPRPFMPSITLPCRGTLVWIPFRSSEKRHRDPFVGIMCWVGISEAAMAAYQRSYQWNSTMHPESSSSCLFSHCVCADNGCPLVCGNQCNATTNRNAVADVALSLKLFVEALQSNLPSSKACLIPQTFDLIERCTASTHVTTSPKSLSTNKSSSRDHSGPVLQFTVERYLAEVWAKVVAVCRLERQHEYRRAEDMNEANSHLACTSPVRPAWIFIAVHIRTIARRGYLLAVCLLSCD
jgi:hypothetical protein